MTTLYELTQDYHQVFDNPELVDPHTGEIIDAEAFQEALDSIEASLSAKLINCAKMVKTYDAEITALKAEEARLRDRRKGIEQSKERLRGYMLAHMVDTQTPRVKCPLFTISVSKGRQKVEVTDAEAVPADYKEIQVTLAKQRIKDHLKAGQDVPGAKLVTGDPSLSIR